LFRDSRAFTYTQGMLNVCLAVIRNDKGLYLAARHARGSRHEGFWEFPGGKLQPGESEEECICREIREELACEIKVVRKLGVFEYPDNTPPLRMHGFLCDLVDGEPKALEHDLLLWLDARNLLELNWLEVDREILGLLQEI